MEISPEKNVARPDVPPTEIVGEPEIIISPPVAVPAASFFPAMARIALAVWLLVVKSAAIVRLLFASREMVLEPVLIEPLMIRF